MDPLPERKTASTALFGRLPAPWCTNSLECSQTWANTNANCEESGELLAMDKVEGPATNLAFLGIHFYSNPLQVSLL